MKIALIMSHGKVHGKNGIFQKALRYAPLTLPTLAALVPEELKAEITIYDEGVEDVSIDKIDADIVGLSCITGIAYHVYETSARLRQRGIKTVIGGLHATLCPTEAMNYADCVITGFAERTWPQALRDFSNGQLKSRYDQEQPFKFEGIPIPRRDLLKKNAYITMNTIQATRGCYQKCDFCVVPNAWGSFWSRPVREVIEEIEKLDKGPFLFLDLSPNEDPEYLKKLYKELIPLKRIWGGLATIEISRDKELLNLANKSGCRGLLIGFESVNQETLRLMGKGKLNVADQYYEDVKRLHGAGIGINGCFVSGHDGDDESCFERTLEFVDRAKIDLPRFSIVTPFPGTALYNKLKSQNRLLMDGVSGWQHYNSQEVVFKPIAMTPDQLLAGHQWLWREAYRLPVIARRFLGSPALHTVMALKHVLPANMAYRFFADKLPELMMTTCETPSTSLPLLLSQ